jgi:hypothetical protein
VNGLEAFLDRLWSDIPGWCFVGLGTGLHLEAGKPKHAAWEEHAYAWPRQRAGLLEAIAEGTKAGDVYITPGRSEGASRQLRWWKPLASRFLWADLDGGDHHDRVDRVVERGGIVVASGRGPGHEHVYVFVDQAVGGDQLALWQRRLVAYLGADPSPSALNGYLRPPQSLNHKPAVLVPGSAPSRVYVEQWTSGPGWALEDLDRILPTRTQGPLRVVADEGPDDWNPQPLPDPLPAQVAAILADPADWKGDRSERLFQLLAACRRVCLSEAQSLGVASHHRPSRAKYGDRLRAETVRVLLKLREVDAMGDPVEGDPVEGDPILVEASRITPEKVRWRWPGRLPVGKVVLLEGDPGLGKSTMTVDWTARITSGTPWPDRSRPEIGNVVICSSEDGAADTIVPRLIAAGANLERVTLLTGVIDDDGLPRPLFLPGDVGAIHRAVNSTSAVLLVVDPLMAFLHGSIDSFRDQDSRRALRPLVALADGTGVTIVVVRHLTKTPGGAAIYRGGGSIGLIAAARAAMVVAADPDDPARRVLAVSKNNLAAFPPSIGYRLVEDEERACGMVRWEGARPFSADQLLAVRVETDEGEETIDAAAVLTTILSEGPVWVKSAVDTMKLAGFTKDQARRAKGKIRARSVKVGKPGDVEQGWKWELRPSEGGKPPPEDGEGGCPQEPAIFATFGADLPPSGTQDGAAEGPP